MIESPEQNIDTQDENNFVLNKEQLESLQLESNLSPERLTELRELIVEANNSILEELDEFIDKPLGNEEIKGKFIFLDGETYNQFYDNWSANNGTSYSDNKGAMRAYLKEGQFVIINSDIPEAWDMLTDGNKQTLIKQQGGFEKAKDFANNAAMTTQITHEATHLYQNTEMPLWLLESQAFWTEDNIVDEDSRASSTLSSKRSVFYQELLNKHGDKVHEVCLGNDEEDFVYWKLDGEFTKEVQQEIFPDYKNKITS